MKIHLLVLLMIAAILNPALFPTTAPESSPTAPHELSLEPIAVNLNYPVHVAHSGDGSGRLFIVEQDGLIRIIANSTVVDEPFLDITQQVRSGGEQGLLSVAFPPGYGISRHHFYVYYTNNNGDNQVSRFYLTQNPDRADPTSEELIIYFDHPQHSNHNGGQLAFGPDGYLYIGTGDGGGSYDPFGNAQDTGSLLGKLLRIDVEMDAEPPFTADYRIFLPQSFQGEPTQPAPTYRVPGDNPFVGRSGYREEIWAIGLRNPWRFSFDRSIGDLYIGDVGQGQREEVDFQPASSNGGENYGWDFYEGSVCLQTNHCGQAGLTMPVSEYPHDGHCSISGGFVYRGSQSPSLSDTYYYADYCSGTIWGMQMTGQGWDAEILANAGFGVSSFGEDEAGELYVVVRSDADLNPGSGAIYHMIETLR